ncbi:hypothetical protein [Arthrobacter terrae]|uniref:hypothetical protein n=1 Tax=Arthrobacter terrae TaxID=2935737 RepID=UPI001E52A2B7|nr:hypothetical protein [Arthrobacter terrae]
MTGWQRLRRVLNLLNLSTPAGLVLALLTGTATQPGPQGLILATDYRPRLPIAGAFTVGNVVIYRADRTFIDANPTLLDHEARHSTQYAWCLGLPFLPLYAAAALFSLWRTGEPGSRNLFERLAGLDDGGYRHHPTVRRFCRTDAHTTAGTMTRTETEVFR